MTEWFRGIPALQRIKVQFPETVLGDSQVSVTPAPGDQWSFSDLCGQIFSCVNAYIHTCKKLILFKNPKEEMLEQCNNR